MKKYLFLLFTANVTFSFVEGQKIKEADVPVAVRSALKKAYPGMNEHWEKENGNYEAGFIKTGKTMSATFQPDGEFMESEGTIKESDLPTAVLDYVKNNYVGKRIKESAKITNAAGVVSFEAEVGGKDVIFNDKGNFLKEVKD